MPKASSFSRPGIVSSTCPKPQAIVGQASTCTSTSHMLKASSLSRPGISCPKPQALAGQASYAHSLKLQQARHSISTCPKPQALAGQASTCTCTATSTSHTPRSSPILSTCPKPQASAGQASTCTCTATSTSHWRTPQTAGVEDECPSEYNKAWLDWEYILGHSSPTHARRLGKARALLACFSPPPAPPWLTSGMP